MHWVNFDFMLTKYGPWDLGNMLVMHSCLHLLILVNYMRAIPHREQPSRYDQGLDAPIQISRLSFQN